ncbi:MAG: hypothetical protein A2X64_10340 [Ignavibacteria bacterium GWF2_33_9]|nr:MAG: hypothetical protein A2X64_10340 [Ignavibacteria bacterium GWF2_33_9]
MENIAPFAAAIVFNPETNYTDIYNLDTSSETIYVNHHLVYKKELLTISDWIRVNDLILDMSNPKFIPLFMPGTKVQFIVDFSDKEVFWIGNTEESRVKFHQSPIKRNYAQIIKSGGNFYICYPPMTMDTHSEFPLIFINEFKLNYGEIQLIESNDSIFIDDLKVDLTLVPGLIDTRESFFSTEVFPLEFNFADFKKETITIGKSGCDICLNSDKISPKHFQIEHVENGFYKVKDLNSSFGTYVDNTKVEELVVTYNQIINFGEFELTLLQHGEEDFIQVEHIKGKIKVDAINLNKTIIEYTFPFQWVRVQILHNISLSIKAGELVGIMGPSGAGKSTLLKLLAGIDKKSRFNKIGKILYNDTDITLNPKLFKNSIAYLPQDDILFPELTVYECLKYVAKLRMPTLLQEDIDLLIDNVLISLDMAEADNNGNFTFPLKNKKIGNINKTGALSGGQRKRVNLAVELLSNPSILFLDEPTSGLSSTGSDKLINLLVKISNSGNTVVTSIHQPSRKIFGKFNKIIILTKSGKLAYFGSVQRSVDYFQRRSKIKYDASSNPAVYILEAMESKSPEFWEKQYLESEAFIHYVQHSQKELENKDINLKKQAQKEKIYNLSQVFTLVKRSLKLKLNNTASLLLLILQTPIIAMCVGLIFSGIIKDGSQLDDFRPEEEFFRLENYSRPVTARYLPPFSEDMKIQNLTSKNLLIYSQANDVLYPDTNYYRQIGPYTISKQELGIRDKMYFPVKSGNYVLVISDSILDEDNLRSAMHFDSDNVTNSNYYILSDSLKTFAVNDWNALSDSQKVALWYDKVLMERKVRVERENADFSKYDLISRYSVFSRLNFLFDKNFTLNQIKKYYYTLKTGKYDWFDATYDKKILYTGSIGYKEQSEKLLNLIFILILSFIWIGMTNSVKDVVVERQIFIRENRYNLKISNYLSSKFLVLLIISSLQVLVFLWVLYLFIPVLPANYWTIALILLLTAMIAGGIGIFISSLASTIEFAIFSLPLILIPQIIFAGVFKHIGAMNEFLRSISAWTISRWSLESMVNAISRTVDFESPFHHFFVPFNNIIYPCYYPTMNRGIVVQTGYFPFVLEIDILILILFAFITFGTSWTILQFKTKFIKK